MLELTPQLLTPQLHPPIFNETFSHLAYSSTRRIPPPLLIRIQMQKHSMGHVKGMTTAIKPAAVNNRTVILI